MQKIIIVLSIYSMLVAFSSDVFSQEYKNSISGYVLDKSTSLPLENVNVYITNTTFGSSTDRHGFYMIKSVPPNIHEIIVSIVGYETIEQKFVVNKETHINQDFKLNPLVYEGSEIGIISSIPEEWLNNLEKFKKVFLGKSFRANKCKIENPEILDFNEEAGILHATAHEPLIVTNEVLGYKIFCNSLMFKYYVDKNTWNWIIKPRYEELPSLDSTQRENWKINRQIAYFGSMYHFLMSLKQKDTKELGYNFLLSDQLLISSSTRYNNIFMIEADSLIKPGISENYHIIHFDKYLLIKNNLIEDHFSEMYDFDLEVGEIFQKSWLKLKYGQMNIDEYGYPTEENAFIVHGYWATLGVADLLPRYYQFNL